MKCVVEEPRVSITAFCTGRDALQFIERMGRVCYKSEHKITDSSCYDFVSRLIKRGHESVLEHVGATASIICDRGVSHELVRHRLASFSQESTRYVRYDNTMVLIKPAELTEGTEAYNRWYRSAVSSCEAYADLIDKGVSPQTARAVLPHSIATTINMTANLREWRHVIKVRTSPQAHPDMRKVMLEVLAGLKTEYPIVFDDLG